MKKGTFHPPESASRYLLTNFGIRRTEKTLAKERHNGGGCPFHVAGRNILYTEGDLDRYAQSLISAMPFRSTAEANAGQTVRVRRKLQPVSGESNSTAQALTADKK